MAQVWQCDRCKAIGDSGNLDDPPDDWAYRSLPVRGSQGARSEYDAVICGKCDDSLYAWSATPSPSTSGDAK